MDGTLVDLNVSHHLGGVEVQAKPAPVAQITRQDPVSEKDWERIVDDQARRGQAAQLDLTPNQTEATSATIKQAVFNDNNYTPRGADNVVSFIEPVSLAEEKKPAQKNESYNNQAKPQHERPRLLAAQRRQH